MSSEPRGHHPPAHAGHHHDRGAARPAGGHDCGDCLQPTAPQEESHLLCVTAPDHYLRQATGYVL